MPYDFQTSLPAYHENRQRKDKCREIILKAIKTLQPCTDKQIADFLQWPINRCTPRRGELVNEGSVAMAKKDRCPETNRTVNFWEVKKSNYQPKMF